MNINNFRTSINSRGVLKNNRFLARFSFRANHYLSGSPALDQNLLSIRCDAATVPGVSFASADGPARLGYGPTEKHPYNTVFDDLTLSFIVDAGSQVHKMLYEWVNVIVNFRAEGASKLKSAAGGRGAYEVGYRDKYDSTLDLIVYRDDNTPSMTFTAYNVFPMGMPQSTLNWQEGEVLKITMPFAYTDYKVSYSDFPLARDPVETGRDSATPRSTEDELASLGGTFVPLG